MTHEELLAKFTVLYEQQGDIVKLLDANNKLLGQQAEYVSELTKVREAQDQTAASTKRIEGAVGGMTGVMDRLHGTIGLVQQAFTALQSAARPVITMIETGVERQKIERSFQAILGSAEYARAELQAIDQWGKDADFALPSLYEADKQLRLFGLDAQKLLPEVSRAADAMGVDVADAVNALSLATLGQTRGLKRYAIDVKEVMRETGVNMVSGSQLTRDEMKKVVDQIVLDWHTKLGAIPDDIGDQATHIENRLRVMRQNIFKIFEKPIEIVMSFVLKGVDKFNTWLESWTKYIGVTGREAAMLAHGYGGSTAATAPPTAGDEDTGDGGGATSPEQAAARHAWNVLRLQMRQTGRGGVGAAELIKSFVDQSSGTSLDWLKDDTEKRAGALDFSSKGKASTVPWLPPVEEVRDKAQIIQDEILRLQAQGLDATMAAQRAYTSFYKGELGKRLEAEKVTNALKLGFDRGFVNSIATNVQRLLTVHKTEKGVEVAIFKAAGREMLADFLDMQADRMKARALEEFAEGTASIASALGFGIGPVSKTASAFKHFAAAALFGLGAGATQGAAGAIHASDQRTQQGIDQGFGNAAYGSSSQPTARDQAFLSGGSALPTNLTINATYIQQGGVQVFGENGFVDFYQQRIRPLIQQDISDLGAIKVKAAA